MIRQSLSRLLTLAFAFSGAAAATELKVMTTGLGSGTVTSAPGGQINCTPGGTDCSMTITLPSPIELTATPDPDNVFVRWHGSCASAGTNDKCNLLTTGNRSVRAEFQPDPNVAPIVPITFDLTPDNLHNYLLGTDGQSVTSPAAFLRALPDEYKQGWILMTRSESLQTGTAKFPRILLPSISAQYVFTIGLSTHSSYPGSHPDAIEFMQWDPDQRNFRFHEVVVKDIQEMLTPTPTGEIVRFPARTRGVSKDEPRCTRCHSTRNVLNPNSTKSGTDGSPPQAGWAKNKPNWDAYDSWGGAMPFNRDRIYQGSVEAAAFRRLLNPWTYRYDVTSRSIMEQLQLQPPLPAGEVRDVIERVEGGAFDGHIRFSFDGGLLVGTEPLIMGSLADIMVDYDFNQMPPEGPSNVERQGNFVLLRAPGPFQPDEGRGVQLFDRLGGFADNQAAPVTNPPNPAAGRFNQHRIGHELGKHVFATGGVPLDARPMALAITKRCIRLDAATNQAVSTGSVALNVDHSFFTARNDGLGLVALRDSTRERTKLLPLRKALIQKQNLDRDADVYLFPGTGTVVDLFSEYGAFTTPAAGLSNLGRIRQEVFLREDGLGVPDGTVMNGIYRDREDYPRNTDRVALFRYFLEPLGVSVDKWSMGVRGRSRTYAFADVFFLGTGPGLPESSTYTEPMQFELQLSLTSNPYGTLAPPFNCDDVVRAVNSSLASANLPRTTLPTYTDVQRIFNKGCIECHGGLGYPPFTIFRNSSYLDVSEDDAPTTSSRLRRSYDNLATRGYLSTNLMTNTLYLRVTQGDELTCPGRMPCGGPRLSEADITTLGRWLTGTPLVYTEGDPHLHTVDGTAYDFQAAGEFTLLRGEGLEVQARQTPVQSDAPLGPDAHTGLPSCPSINTAAAFQVGAHRITLQPNLSGQPDPSGMQLRVDGKLQEKLGSRGITLPEGGRIMPTTAQGGVLIQVPGGTEVVVTPQWWSYYQLWYLNIQVRHARTNFGVMGAITPGNWLPALADGSFLGPIPASLSDRHSQLYGKFADSWRVTNASSLFDYASGTSTATFTLKGWPVFDPKSCYLPRSWAPRVPPQKGLSNDAAKQQCSAIVDAERRDNCERDLMTTGDPSFVQAYLATEKIERNLKPRVPVLLSPREDEIGLPGSVLFEWKASSDKDQGTLRYMHCVWPAKAKHTFRDCTDVPAGVLSAVASGLEAGTDYRWKVLVEDGQGATVESMTLRFATK